MITTNTLSIIINYFVTTLFLIYSCIRSEHYDTILHHNRKQILNSYFNMSNTRLNIFFIFIRDIFIISMQSTQFETSKQLSFEYSLVTLFDVLQAQMANHRFSNCVSDIQFCSCNVSAKRVGNKFKTWLQSGMAERVKGMHFDIK